MQKATLTFTVINDLLYDQRMQKICTTLANNGFDVTLIGTEHNKSRPLIQQVFKQKRIKVYFKKSIFLYLEYNIKLFVHLLFHKTDVYGAIDLDTILPNYFASLIKRKKRFYDAHELFTELIEVVRRPLVQKIWLGIEKFTVPKFIHGYTVNTFIQQEFKKRYGVDYIVIQNLPTLSNAPHPMPTINNNRIILYQGAVNEGRGFENLIPAMENVNALLHIYGEGNFFEEAKKLIQQYNLQSRVKLFGKVIPNDLKNITPNATLGITIFESNGLNQIYSLANRFFDYIMAGIPQLCVAYPEYQEINDKHNVAYLIPSIEKEKITNALNYLLENVVLLQQLKNNTLVARETLNWENQEKKLIAFWKNICTS
ncbi:MAG: glycosyltransferase [Chitinophagaceae bacterium]